MDWRRVRRSFPAGTPRPEARRKARYSDPEHDMLLLHFVCALRPPLEVVQAVVAAYPEAVARSSREVNLTPLMIACGRNASPSVIHLLCELDKSAINRFDESGYAAIHWACRQNVSHAVMKVLLGINPSQSCHMVRPRTIGGEAVVGTGRITALEILYQNRSSTAQLGTAWDSNQWKKLCYLLWAHHYGSVSARSEHSYSTLHAALACQCPKGVVDTALSYYVNTMAGVRDLKGNLPLHYAVKSKVIDRDQMLRVLSAFRAAAGATDANGCLPLHEAIKAGRSWTSGTSEIYELFPAAASLKDKGSCLPPALLAAAKNDLDATFALLEQFPDFVESK